MLSFRERRVLEMRFGLSGFEPCTLDEVGAAFHVTRERIRQIENQALKKLSSLSEAAHCSDSATARRLAATLRAVRQEHTLLEDGLPAGHSRCDTRASGRGLAPRLRRLPSALPRPDRTVVGEASLDAEGRWSRVRLEVDGAGGAARRAARRAARHRGRARARRRHRPAPDPRRHAPGQTRDVEVVRVRADRSVRSAQGPLHLGRRPRLAPLPPARIHGILGSPGRRRRGRRGGCPARRVSASRAARCASCSAPATRAIVLAGLGASFLASFDLLIVVSALPSAARDVGDINNYALAAGAYSVASVVGMPLAGIVNDRIGPLRTLLVGSGVFFVGTVVGGTATSMDQIAAGRLLQGFGGGFLLSVPLVLWTAYLPAPPRALRLRRQRRRVGDLGRDRAAHGRAARRARRLARGLLGQPPAARADARLRAARLPGPARSRRTSTARANILGPLPARRLRARAAAAVALAA